MKWNYNLLISLIQGTNVLDKVSHHHRIKTKWSSRPRSRISQTEANLLTFQEPEVEGTLGADANIIEKYQRAR